MSRDPYIRPPYFLDPLILLENDLADRLYGRITKVGRNANGGNPQVWVLLMRNMYGILQGDDTGPAGKTRGRNKTVEDIKALSSANIRRWAFAFNTAIKSQVSAGYFKKPNSLDRESSPSDWSPPVEVVRGDLLKKKWNRYINEDRRVTNEILKRMEEFRLAVQADYQRDPTLQLNPE